MHLDDRVVPLRAHFECENIDICEHHLKEVARNNSLRRGDGRWRGHHSIDPSERRPERTFGSTGPGRAKLERAGVNLEHFCEEIRFEYDSVLVAMAGIIATPNAHRIGGSCLSDRGSFAALYSHFLVVLFA